MVVERPRPVTSIGREAILRGHVPVDGRNGGPNERATTASLALLLSRGHDSPFEPGKAAHGSWYRHGDPPCFGLWVIHGAARDPGRASIALHDPGRQACAAKRCPRVRSVTDH
jgi:hypothetical protein